MPSCLGRKDGLKQEDGLQISSPKMSNAGGLACAYLQGDSAWVEPRRGKAWGQAVTQRTEIGAYYTDKNRYFKDFLQKIAAGEM